MKKFNIVIDCENITDEMFNYVKLKYPLPETLQLNLCKIGDINNYENFYYVVHEFNFYQDCLDKNKTLNFSENINDAITNKNLKVMFVNPHESPYDLKEFVYKLQNIIKSKNWKESQFYIIDNNSLIYKTKQKTNSKINFYKTNFLLKMMLQMTTQPSINDITFNKKFIFLCLNRGHNTHRLALLTYLKNSKLLENNITDWSRIIPPEQNSKKIQSIQRIKKYIEINNKDLVDDYLNIVNQKKISFYEQGVEYFDKIEYYKQTEHLVLDSYKNSYINIVTETVFEYNTLDIMHITEKSFKPFYYFQIPIFVATYNHIKTMRSEYDFYFFDDLIDHSYDDEIDDAKRFRMIINEIKRLSTIKEEISIYYKNNIDKLMHNHNFIKEYPKKQIEENYFLNLINENK